MTASASDLTRARGQGGGPRAAASRQSCLSRGHRPGPRSPPRPSPGGLHYSDEDICSKYNGAVLAETVNLKEKPVDASESEVSARGRRFPVCVLRGHMSCPTGVSQ